VTGDIFPGGGDSNGQEQKKPWYRQEYLLRFDEPVGETMPGMTEEEAE
jgi:hypothetical protein